MKSKHKAGKSGIVRLDSTALGIVTEHSKATGWSSKRVAGMMIVACESNTREACMLAIRRERVARGIVENAKAKAAAYRKGGTA